MPIVNHSGKVLGTFGTYYRAKTQPEPEEIETVRHLAQTAALVLSS